jgi:hypothetical protein
MPPSGSHARNAQFAKRLQTLMDNRGLSQSRTRRPVVGGPGGGVGLGGRQKFSYPRKPGKARADAQGQGQRPCVRRFWRSVLIPETGVEPDAQWRVSLGGGATGGGTGAGGLLGPAARGFALAFRAMAASRTEAAMGPGGIGGSGAGGGDGSGDGSGDGAGGGIGSPGGSGAIAAKGGLSIASTCKGGGVSMILRQNIRSASAAVIFSL